MRGKWLVIIMAVLTATLLFTPACKTQTNVSDTDSKTITVTMMNTSAAAVHIYVEGQTPNDNNLVQPGGNQTTQFVSKKVVHNVTFYVQQGGTVLATIICTVGQTAWDSGQSVVEWDGQTLICVTW